MSEVLKKSDLENKNVSDWAAKDEVIKTSFPLYLTLLLIKKFPRFFTNLVIYIVSFFYYLFNKRAKSECRRFQKIFLENQKSGAIKKISPYKQILAFAITLVEKMECWVKGPSSVKLNFHNDDVQELINWLDSGKGAFVLCSHLGNSELLRHLANNNSIYLKREIPIAVLMDLGSTKVFTETLKKINPDFSKNIIDINSINPGTIEILQETIEAGGLVISAGDRISKNSDSKFLTAPFLGKDAPWSYGVYLIASLLKVPVYFMFGLRKNFASCNRDYDFFIKKSLVDFNCPRKEREEKIKNLCLEFSSELEKKCKMQPFQWFNFYDFWAFPN